MTMSCFGGRMLEYQNISIDRYDGINLKSTAFFLSHCHEDHTAGLDKDAFTERLVSRNDIFLYCSEVTKILLLASSKFQHLEKYLRILPVGIPTVVPIPEIDSAKTEDVTVTLLHAGHCPGSVMFLFEGSEGTVLYTGDFRWESDKVTQVQALHKDGRVKHIRSLYIDTTFCHPDSIYIPPRVECVSVVCELVREWLRKDENNVVHVMSRTRYGHEPLYKEIAESTGHKVHVSEEKCDIYGEISELKDIFTSSPTETKIHACWSQADNPNYGGLPCRPHPSRDHVMRILPSTMFFTMKMRLQQKEFVIHKNDLHRVCFSFHSSLLEVRDLVTYLSPERVRPNVKPLPDRDLSVVQRRLNEFLKMKNSKMIRFEEDSQRPLGLLKPSKITRKVKHKAPSVSSDSDELVFGSQGLDVTPPKKIKYSPPIKLSPGGAANELSSEDDSSYAGSQREDSEISDLCEQHEDNPEDQSEDKTDGPGTLSTPSRSLLDAIISQEEEDVTVQHRFCLSELEEENFEKPLSLEDVEDIKDNTAENEDVLQLEEDGEDAEDDASVVHVVDEKAEAKGPKTKMDDPKKCRSDLEILHFDGRGEDEITDRNQLQSKSENNTGDLHHIPKNENQQSQEQSTEDSERSYELFDNSGEVKAGEGHADLKCELGTSDEENLDQSKEEFHSCHSTHSSQGFETDHIHAQNQEKVINQDDLNEKIVNTDHPEVIMKDGRTTAKRSETGNNVTDVRRRKKKIGVPEVDILFHSDDSRSSSSSEKEVEGQGDCFVSNEKGQGHSDRDITEGSQIDIDKLMEEDTESLEHDSVCDLTVEEEFHSCHGSQLIISSGEVKSQNGCHGDYLDLTVSSGEIRLKNDEDDGTERKSEKKIKNIGNNGSQQTTCITDDSSEGDREVISQRQETTGPQSSLREREVDIQHPNDIQSDNTDHSNKIICMDDYESDSDVALPPTPLKNGRVQAPGYSNLKAECSDSDATLPPTPQKNGITSSLSPAVSSLNLSPSYKQTNIVQYMSPPKHAENGKSSLLDRRNSSQGSDTVCSPTLLKRHRQSTANQWLTSKRKHVQVVVVDDDEDDSDDDREKRKRKARKVIDLTQSDDEA